MGSSVENHPGKSERGEKLSLVCLFSFSFPGAVLPGLVTVGRFVSPSSLSVLEGDHPHYQEGQKEEEEEWYLPCGLAACSSSGKRVFIYSPDPPGVFPPLSRSRRGSVSGTGGGGVGYQLQQGFYSPSSFSSIKEMVRRRGSSSHRIVSTPTKKNKGSPEKDERKKIVPSTHHPSSSPQEDSSFVLVSSTTSSSIVSLPSAYTMVILSFSEFCTSIAAGERINQGTLMDWERKGGAEEEFLFPPSLCRCCRLSSISPPPPEEEDISPTALPPGGGGVLVNDEDGGGEEEEKKVKRKREEEEVELLLIGNRQGVLGYDVQCQREVFFSHMDEPVRGLVHTRGTRLHVPNAGAPLGSHHRCGGGGGGGLPLFSPMTLVASRGRIKGVDEAGSEVDVSLPENWRGSSISHSSGSSGGGGGGGMGRGQAITAIALLPWLSHLSFPPPPLPSPASSSSLFASSGSIFCVLVGDESGTIRVLGWSCEVFATMLESSCVVSLVPQWQSHHCFHPPQYFSSSDDYHQLQTPPAFPSTFSTSTSIGGGKSGVTGAGGGVKVRWSDGFASCITRRFAYLLSSGSMGVYHDTERIWCYTPSPAGKQLHVSAVTFFDVDGDGIAELVLGWENGVVEIRTLAAPPPHHHPNSSRSASSSTRSSSMREPREGAFRSFSQVGKGSERHTGGGGEEDVHSDNHNHKNLRSGSRSSGVGGDGDDDDGTEDGRRRSSLGFSSSHPPLCIPLHNTNGQVLFSQHYSSPIAGLQTVEYRRRRRNRKRNDTTTTTRGRGGGGEDGGGDKEVDDEHDAIPMRFLLLVITVDGKVEALEMNPADREAVQEKKICWMLMELIKEKKNVQKRVQNIQQEIHEATVAENEERRLLAGQQEQHQQVVVEGEEVERDTRKRKNREEGEEREEEGEDPRQALVPPPPPHRNSNTTKNRPPPAFHPLLQSTMQLRVRVLPHLFRPDRLQVEFLLYPPPGAKTKSTIISAGLHCSPPLPSSSSLSFLRYSSRNRHRGRNSGLVMEGEEEEEEEGVRAPEEEEDENEEEDLNGIPAVEGTRTTTGRGVEECWYFMGRAERKEHRENEEEAKDEDESEDDHDEGEENRLLPSLRAEGGLGLTAPSSSSSSSRPGELLCTSSLLCSLPWGKELETRISASVTVSDGGPSNATHVVHVHFSIPPLVQYCHVEVALARWGGNDFFMEEKKIKEEKKGAATADEEEEEEEQRRSGMVLPFEILSFIEQTCFTSSTGKPSPPLMEGGGGPSRRVPRLFSQGGRAGCGGSNRSPSLFHSAGVGGGGLQPQEGGEEEEEEEGDSCPCPPNKKSNHHHHTSFSSLLYSNSHCPNNNKKKRRKRKRLRLLPLSMMEKQVEFQFKEDLCGKKIEKAFRHVFHIPEHIPLDPRDRCRHRSHSSSSSSSPSSLSSSSPYKKDYEGVEGREREEEEEEDEDNEDEAEKIEGEHDFTFWLQVPLLYIPTMELVVVEVRQPSSHALWRSVSLYVLCPPPPPPPPTTTTTTTTTTSSRSTNNIGDWIPSNQPHDVDLPRNHPDHDYEEENAQGGGGGERRRRTEDSSFSPHYYDYHHHQPANKSGSLASMMEERNIYNPTRCSPLTRCADVLETLYQHLPNGFIQQSDDESEEEKEEAERGGGKCFRKVSATLATRSSSSPSPLERSASLSLASSSSSGAPYRVRYRNFQSEGEDLQWWLQRMTARNEVATTLMENMADSIATLRLLLGQADEARLLGELQSMKLSYIDVLEGNRDLIAENKKRKNNVEEGKQTIRQVHGWIQQAARLRRLPQERMLFIDACQKALQANDFGKLIDMVTKGEGGE